MKKEKNYIIGEEIKALLNKLEGINERGRVKYEALLEESRRVIEESRRVNREAEKAIRESKESHRKVEETIREAKEANREIERELKEIRADIMPDSLPSA